MFKNKNNNVNNLCGGRIATLRINAVPSLSQRGLASKMQLLGIDLDKNAIQRIECGKRFVTDIELKAFSQCFKVSSDYLLGLED